MTKAAAFFEGWSWFKINNMKLALGMTLKFYISGAKMLKLKVRKVCGLMSMFLEVTGERFVRGTFCPPPPSILNRVTKVEINCVSMQIAYIEVNPCN